MLQCHDETASMTKMGTADCQMLARDSSAAPVKYDGRHRGPTQSLVSL